MRSPVILRDPTADDRPSRMIVIGIERRADGVLVVHAPSRGQPAQTLEVTGPPDLWAAIRDLLNDPNLPRVETVRAGDVSLEDALGQLLQHGIQHVVNRHAPYIAPIVGQAVKQASKKADGILKKIQRNDDVHIRRYPRGT